jgi:hypothetical protein
MVQQRLNGHAEGHHTTSLHSSLSLSMSFDLPPEFLSMHAHLELWYHTRAEWFTYVSFTHLEHMPQYFVSRPDKHMCFNTHFKISPPMA